MFIITVYCVMWFCHYAPN